MYWYYVASIILMFIGVLLYKSREKWSESQKQRANMLFMEYPDLEKAYQLTDNLRKIYNQNIGKSVAMTKLAH